MGTLGSDRIHRGDACLNCESGKCLVEQADVLFSEEIEDVLIVSYDCWVRLDDVQLEPAQGQLQYTSTQDYALHAPLGGLEWSLMTPEIRHQSQPFSD